MSERSSDVRAHVLWSHGMGAKKDSKLYRAIRDEISPRGYEFHTFSYDEEHDNGDTTVRVFQERPPILEEEIKRLNTVRKVGQKLIFLGWSQGCLTTPFVDMSSFDQVVYLNPMVKDGTQAIAATIDEDRKAEMAAESKQGKVKQMSWELKDADGNKYISFVPMAYFPSVRFDTYAAYKEAAELKRPIIFHGSKDEMTGLTGEYQLDNAEYHEIEGANHFFSGTANRQKLISALCEYAFPEL